MTPSSWQRILYSVNGPIAAIVLNRPEKRNAIDGLLIEELRAALADARKNEAIRVVTLSAAGKDFCSGADLAQLEKARASGVMANMEDARSMAELFIEMRRNPKLIVALVRGRALAGGCGLATACDLILTDETAQFGYPEVNIGFVPAMVMAILRRSITEKRALELVCTGNLIPAGQALSFGLINQVYTTENFDQLSVEFVEKLASKSASALALTKSLLYHMDSVSFETALEAGVQINGIARLTPDCQEGVNRFLKGSKMS
jgi:methylglutaconyl-CoA hydratase